MPARWMPDMLTVENIAQDARSFLNILMNSYHWNVHKIHLFFLIYKNSGRSSREMTSYVRESRSLVLRLKTEKDSF